MVSEPGDQWTDNNCLFLFEGRILNSPWKNRGQRHNLDPAQEFQARCRFTVSLEEQELNTN